MQEILTRHMVYYFFGRVWVGWWVGWWVGDGLVGAGFYEINANLS